MSWDLFVIMMVLPVTACVAGGIVYVGVTRDRPWF